MHQKSSIREKRARVLAFVERKPYTPFTIPVVDARIRVVDTSSSRWNIGETSPILLNFSRFKGESCLIAAEFVDSLKFFFARELPRKSPLTCYGMFNLIFDFLSSYNWEEADGESLTELLSDNLIDYIYAKRMLADESNLSGLRYWYHRSYLMGLPGFDQQTAKALTVFRFKGNLKGLDVLSYIPNRSPLTAQELNALKQALNEAASYIKPKSQVFANLVCMWLVITLGIRSRQLALLMRSDFLVNVDLQTGQRTYQLSVPSVKKRFETPRLRFQLRTLPTFLGKLLEQHLALAGGGSQLTLLDGDAGDQANQASQASEVLTSTSGCVSLTSQQVMEANKREESYARKLATQPIFPIEKVERRQTTQSVHKSYLHTSSSGRFSLMLHQLMDTIDKYRAKTGKPLLNLVVTPRRLRKTFATHAAAMGTPIVELAQLLDHEDLQHVMVYYQLGMSFAEKLDQVFQEQFKDILAYFKGSINLADLIDKSAPNTVFGPDKLRRLVGIGMCAKGTPCDLTPPNACYVCPKFEACKDPKLHRDVLESMKEDVKACFGEDAPPGLFNAPHIRACEELTIKLESCNG
ncbi:site-specific integrase [Rheinheimera marina]|uniref:Site-specific integrase n=1 Tax=Rheinheimera marina TaxID=1774958 RepID=A0ABV9JGV7_9GAMM